VIDPGVLEIDDEPIAARELDTDAQRSQLRDHLLGLPATLRENLVPPLLPGHGSRLVPNNDRPAAERGDRSRPSRIEAIHTPVVTLRGCARPHVSSWVGGQYPKAPGHMPASGRIPATHFTSQGIYPDLAYAATALRGCSLAPAASGRG
jgi:hypothetical protein